MARVAICSVLITSVIYYVVSGMGVDESVVLQGFALLVFHTIKNIAGIPYDTFDTVAELYSDDEALKQRADDLDTRGNADKAVFKIIKTAVISQLLYKLIDILFVRYYLADNMGFVYLSNINAMMFVLLAGFVALFVFWLSCYYLHKELQSKKEIHCNKIVINYSKTAASIVVSCLLVVVVGGYTNMDW